MPGQGLDGRDCGEEIRLDSEAPITLSAGTRILTRAGFFRTAHVSPAQLCLSSSPGYVLRTLLSLCTHSPKMAQSFTSISADGRHSLAGTADGFDSEGEEEEIDQLDSGLDDEEEVEEEDEGEEMEPEVEEYESASAMKGRRKLGVRVPGHTLLPQDKLDNILQAEGMCTCVVTAIICR